MTDDERLTDLAGTLYDAYRDGTAVDPLRTEHDLSVADGYAVQDEVIERRRADEGDVAGYKIGFTSDAIQTELGVDEPAYGRILDDTVVPEGRVDFGNAIDPQVEAELAFVVGRDLDAPTSPPAVLAAMDAVFPAIEVVDSRVADWDVSPPEAIADNALSGRVVHGEAVRDPTALDLALEGVQVLKNGEGRATGVGADVLGNPANALAWLVGALAERGDALEAGDLVITGSTTPLVALEPGDVVEARFASLGSVTVRRG